MQEQSNMLRPAITQLITKNESYYSLVIGVAKRARNIADTIYKNSEELKEKPVKTAIDELASGKYKIIEWTEEQEKEEKEKEAKEEVKTVTEE